MKARPKAQPKAWAKAKTLSRLAKAKTLSRLKLLALFAAFAGPVVLASVLYFGQQWFEFESTANGYLMPPGQTLAAPDFHQLSSHQASETRDTPRTTSLLDGRWLLLFNGAAACDLYCQANLFKMRQARLVLGRDLKRVRTIYLLPNGQMPTPDLNRLLEHYPALALYRSNDAAQLAAQAPDLIAAQIYIVDPLGNLVLRYAPDAYSRHIIKDFKRLLKASKIG